jgi:NodT family efflux transporter outer membrane factor (OMF) lipoprotein
MRALPVLVVLLIAVACAPIPRIGAAQNVRAPESLGSSVSLSQSATDWPVDRWWIGFGDAQLDVLIGEGLSASPDIAAAAARVASADALAQQAGAALDPNLSVDAFAGGTKQSKNLGIPPSFVPDGVLDTGRITATATFNFDAWGRNRAALAAARGEAEATRVDAAQARLLLTTGIAAAYTTLAQYHADRDVAVAALGVRQSTARLTAQRVAVGVDNRGAAAQADARVPQAKADIAALDEAIVLTQHRLAALVGAGPDRGRSIVRPTLTSVPVGVPAKAGIDLIGRRPDIIAARLRTQAAADRIKIARADFYPNVNLTALVGLQSLGLGNLLQGGSSYGNGGLAISLPLFDAGRIAGRYRGARADYDAAVARYDVTLINALHEAADAATSRAIADRRLEQLHTALTSAEEARRIASLRYASGLSNQLPVLTADDTVLALRRLVADTDARRTAIDIALIRALGGGYRETSSRAGNK